MQEKHVTEAQFEITTDTNLNGDKYPNQWQSSCKQSVTCFNRKPCKKGQVLSLSLSMPTTGDTCDLNYFLLLKLIADSGLQIDFSNMYTETYSTGNNESYHYFQITALCNKKRCMLKITKRGNVDHVYVPEFSFDSGRKTLYISKAEPWYKIYYLVNIFKWWFETVRKLMAEERRRQQKLLLAVMLTSHPRLGEAAPMFILNDDLLETTARLSLS